MNFARKQGGRRSDVLLDMTPLIDVVFLLLIFFLITTTFIKRREEVVPISLPTGQAEQIAADPAEIVTIHIDDVGGYSLTVGERASMVDIARDTLRDELATLFETDSGLTILLRGDRQVDYGAVMDVWMLAQEVGFERVQAVIRQARGADSGTSPISAPP